LQEFRAAENRTGYREIRGFLRRSLISYPAGTSTMFRVRNPHFERTPCEKYTHQKRRCSGLFQLHLPDRLTAKRMVEAPSRHSHDAE
jgi:hypothetical protein